MVDLVLFIGQCVWVVDDDCVVCFVLCIVLCDVGYQVDGFDGVVVVLLVLDVQIVLDLLFIDVCMFGDDGLVLFDKFKVVYLQLLVIVMLVYIDVVSIVGVFCGGVQEFLFKLFDLDDVVVLVQCVLLVFDVVFVVFSEFVVFFVLDQCL